MQYDVIVIGAGPGGYEAAAIEASKGQKVLLIEKDLLGGTCLNRGCIPTKTLCRSAETALEVASAGDYGVDIAPGTAVAYNLAKIMERKRAVVEQLRQGVAAAVAKADTVKGHARFTAPHAVEVDGQEYTADKIIVATGSEPAMLPIPGRELTIDSTAMLEITALPASLAVIGGGVIGMEFASIFAAWGVKVSVVEYCKEILPPFDKDIAKRLRTALQKRGVDFYVGAEVKAVTGEPQGDKAVHFLLKGREQQVAAEVVLMAVGRRPVVPEGLAEKAGAEVGRRGVAVGDDFQTAAPGVYAIGDCNGRCMLAHAASAQAAVVAGEAVRLDVVPSAVFTVPECAMVGRTEEQCKAEGIAVRTAKIPFRGNGKALAMGEAEGLVKVIVAAAEQPEGSPAKPGELLGAALCGPHASDLVAEPALAMAAGLTAADICATIHSHPSLSEAVLAAFRAVR